MTVIYRAHTASESDGNCGYCRDPMVNTKCVAHTGAGSKHPMHLDCVKLLADAAITRCPTCNIQTDVNTLHSWKERYVSELKSIAVDAALGLGAGLAVFTCQLGLGDEAARQVAIAEAAAISLGFGGYIALYKLENNGYHNTAGLVFLPLALSMVGGMLPSVGAFLAATKGIVLYGSATAYKAASVLTAVTGVAVSSGTTIGVSLGSAFEDGFKVESRYLGKIGAALGAATSAIALGIVGLDFEERKYGIHHQQFSYEETNAALNKLFLTVLVTSVAVATIGTVVGGFLGRRCSRL